MTYRLTNGSKIDEEAVCAAMGNDSRKGVSFLDLETGATNPAFRPDEATRMGEQNQKYRLIPIVSTQKKLSWMKEFVRLFLEQEDTALSAKLTVIFRQSSDFSDVYARACSIINGSAEGWGACWSQWLGDHLWEEMGDFLYAIDSDIEDVWEGEDDCAVCDAMRSAHQKGESLSENALLAAFQTAKLFQNEQKGE